MCSRQVFCFVDADARAHPCEQVFGTALEKRLPAMNPPGAGGSRMLEPLTLHGQKAGHLERRLSA